MDEIKPGLDSFLVSNACVNLSYKEARSEIASRCKAHLKAGEKAQFSPALIIYRP